MTGNQAKSRNRFWMHAVLWGSLYLAWLLLFQKRSFSFSRTLSVQFCYLGFVAANYYFNSLFNIPRFLYRKKFVAFAGLLLAGILVAACLRVPLAQYLNKNYFIPGQPQPGWQDLFLNSLVNIFIWVICLVAGKIILDRFLFQKYVTAIEKEKSAAELDFLKAQFNPHFLFNSINSIYGHIDRKNVSARQMLLSFSEMLRYQLYECNTDFIGMDKELQFIRNYIALQRSRKEESLIVQLDVGEEIKSFKIAPLLFIAFIENCFKYVSDQEPENRVDISFKKSDGGLVFRAYNTKHQHITQRREDRQGIGIANVKRRLELLYPRQYELLIHDEEKSHEVILKLQLS